MPLGRNGRALDNFPCLEANFIAAVDSNGSVQFIYQHILLSYPLCNNILRESYSQGKVNLLISILSHRPCHDQFTSD
jgi:hypothetical protein